MRASTPQRTVAKTGSADRSKEKRPALVLVACPSYVTPHHVTSRHITSRHITSHHVTSRHAANAMSFSFRLFRLLNVIFLPSPPSFDSPRRGVSPPSLRASRCRCASDIGAFAASDPCSSEFNRCLKKNVNTFCYVKNGKGRCASK